MKIRLPTFPRAGRWEPFSACGLGSNKVEARIRNWESPKLATSTYTSYWYKARTVFSVRVDKTQR